MNWLDAGILILLGFGALRGFRRGIGAVFVGLGGLLLALLASGYTTPRVAAWLQSRYGVVDAVGSFLQRYLRLPIPDAALRLGDMGPAEVEAALDALPVGAWLRQLLVRQGPGVAAMAGGDLATLGDVVYHLLGGYLVAAACFAGLFFAFRAILIGVGSLLTRILAATPVIGPGSRMLGAGLGIAEQGVMAAVAIGLATALVPLFPGLATVLEGSALAPLGLSLFHVLVPMALSLGAMISP
jgi:uncharacterized membrane protein required for colicin V production